MLAAAQRWIRRAVCHIVAVCGRMAAACASQRLRGLVSGPDSCILDDVEVTLREAGAGWTGERWLVARAPQLRGVNLSVPRAVRAKGRVHASCHCPRCLVRERHIFKSRNGMCQNTS